MALSFIANNILTIIIIIFFIGLHVVDVIKSESIFSEYTCKLHITI